MSANRVMRNISHFIEEKLGLEVNMTKSKVDKQQGLKYLGFGFYFDTRAHQYKAKPHAKSVAKFKKRMRELTCRSWGVSNSYKVEKLNQLISGWINYLKIGSMKTLCKELDKRIRYRIRMCIWKQWKTPQNRIKNLMKLGVEKDTVWSTAYTGKRIAYVCQRRVMNFTHKLKGILMEYYDKIIIGAGLYGLYSALFCGEKGQSVLVLECDLTPFRRATYINQARVHQEYHYPRSISTAMKSAGYFERFNRDYDFCINREFDKVYATASQYSWSNGEQFENFCKAANIPCEKLHPERFFKDRMCDEAFLTREYTYDAMILRDYYLDKLAPLKNVEIKYGISIERIEKLQDAYALYVGDIEYRTGFLLNATYAGTNQILDMVGFEKFGIKYELCEIILCDVNKKLYQYGFTIMDGPFFSIMPFGKTGLHSLTSVTFTPHVPRFIEKLEEGYDFIQGSHFVGGGKAINTPFVRIVSVKLIHAPIISMTANQRFTDTTNAYRAYSRRYLTDDRVQPLRDIFVTYELLAYLSVRATQIGMRACEVPVTRAYPKKGKFQLR